MFKSGNNLDTEIQTRIKLPGQTWHEMSINSKVKIIYLPKNPSVAELENRVKNKMIYVALFGFAMVIFAGIGFYYREGIVRWLKSRNIKNETT